MAPLNHQIFGRVLVAAMLVAVLAVAGCGRKGPLEPPPGAALTSDPVYPGAPPPPPDGGPKKPARPFFLDFLI